MELAIKDKTNSIQEIMNKISNLPTKVEDINFGLTISEMNTNEAKLSIIAIIQKYLSKNIKGKALHELDQIDLVIDFLLEDCKNLQLEDINIIFKNGILGRYGTIYNDISVDTICGIDGWIESYYKQDRAKRIENKKSELQKKELEYEKPILNGNEMTYEQWMEKHPEYKKQIRIKEVRKVLSSKNATINNVIEYCELLGHNWENKKVRLIKEYDQFEHKEMLNFEQWCIIFIKSKIK